MQLSAKEKKVGIYLAVFIVGMVGAYFLIPPVVHFILDTLVMDVLIVLEGLVIAGTGGMFALVATWFTWKAFIGPKQEDFTPLGSVFDQLEDKFNRDMADHNASWAPEHIQFAESCSRIMGERIRGIVLMFVSYLALYVLIFAILSASNILS